MYTGSVVISILHGPPDQAITQYIQNIKWSLMNEQTIMITRNDD